MNIALSVQPRHTGTHSITAVYGGDTNFNGSSSSPINQVVTATVADFTLSGTGFAQGVQPGNRQAFPSQRRR